MVRMRTTVLPQWEPVHGGRCPDARRTPMERAAPCVRNRLHRYTRPFVRRLARWYAAADREACRRRHPRSHSPDHELGTDARTASVTTVLLELAAGANDARLGVGGPAIESVRSE